MTHNFLLYILGKHVYSLKYGQLVIHALSKPGRRYEDPNKTGPIQHEQDMNVLTEAQMLCFDKFHILVHCIGLQSSACTP